MISKIRFLSAVLSAVLICSCSPGRTDSPGVLKAAVRPVPVASAEGGLDLTTPSRHGRRARQIASGLSIEAACGQLVMTGVSGRGVLDQASRILLEEIPAGAIVLFGFNVPEEASNLTVALDQAQAIAGASGAGIPLFVAIDHEGGEVFRFKRGVTALPSARSIGDRGSLAAAEAGATAGGELKSLGISLNLAPVVESRDDRNAGFLKTRAFSSDPRTSGVLAAAFLRAHQSAGTAATAKHYPGNGSEDPHAAVPVVDVSREDLERRYELPFRAAIKAEVAAVMLSHARFPVLDPEEPASLSPVVIGRLKKDLGFRGIVLTDDLAMKALSGQGGVGPAAVKAVLAGADMVMTSGGRGAREAYGALVAAVRAGDIPEKRVRDAAARILEQKLRFGLLRNRERGT